jgi:hypothetical protein
MPRPSVRECPRDSRTGDETALQNPLRGADAGRVIVPMLIAVGFILGLVVGRWWALAAPIGFGVWVAIVSEVEVPGWFLGLWYGAIGCVGIGTGIVVRRAIHRLRHTA